MKLALYLCGIFNDWSGYSEAGLEDGCNGEII